MKADRPQHKPGGPVALKGIPAGKNKEEETDDLHDRERPASRNTSVADAPAASPVRFYARLRRDLDNRGIDIDRLPRKTAEGGSPPCFDHADSDYEAWLSSASLLGAIVPYRFDMPAEPNYCFDCTPEHKRRAVAAGTCLFPNTKFEKRQTVVQDDDGKGIEIELVGVSRSDTVAFNLKAEYDPEE